MSRFGLLAGFPTPRGSWSHGNHPANSQPGMLSQGKAGHILMAISSASFYTVDVWQAFVMPDLLLQCTKIRGTAAYRHEKSVIGGSMASPVPPPVLAQTWLPRTLNALNLSVLYGKVYFTLRERTVHQLIKTSFISLSVYVISPWRFQLPWSPQVLLKSEQAEQRGGNDLII